jgi:hypothetical protein
LVSATRTLDRGRGAGPMKRPYHRVGFTAAQSAELWDRWRRGEGLKAIGRVIGKPSSCVFGHLSLSGGIRPPPRRRSRLALTLAEREEISRNLAAGQSLRSIARTLGRPGIDGADPTRPRRREDARRPYARRGRTPGRRCAGREISRCAERLRRAQACVPAK